MKKRPTNTLMCMYMDSTPLWRQFLINLSLSLFTAAHLQVCFEIFDILHRCSCNSWPRFHQSFSRPLFHVLWWLFVTSRCQNRPLFHVLWWLFFFFHQGRPANGTCKKRPCRWKRGLVILWWSMCPNSQGSSLLTFRMDASLIISSLSLCIRCLGFRI